MRAIEIMRKAIVAPTLKTLGDRSVQPRYLATHKNDPASRGEVLRLPSRRLDDAQVFDATDPNFGAFVFVLGLDGIGDGPIG